MSFHQHRSDYGYRRDDQDGARIDFRHTVRRWLDWAKTRPTESWMFFAAGLVLGGIVM